MTLVRMAASHLDAVVSIEQIDGDVGWTRAHFEKELELPLSRFFVAEESGVVLGYGGYWKVLDEAQLVNLVVAGSARRAGVGTSLVDQLSEQARADRCLRLTLEVRDSNTAARGLYRKAGFLEVGRRPHFYSAPDEEAVLMEKVL